MARDKFYCTTAWLRAREEALRRDHYLCVPHRRRGIFEPATTVHHIAHFKDAPEEALNIDNLLSVCKDCHNQLHPERARARGGEEMTAPGGGITAPASVNIIKM